MDISIIIVNYKSKGFTLSCLKSIEEAEWGKLQHEVIVVDNASDDGIGEILAWQHPKVVFIQSQRNLGMGGGNNLGIRRAKGEYVVIMNPDTLAFKDTFLKLHAFMESHSDVGMVGPKQFHPDQTVQDSCYRWHNLLTPLIRRTFLGRFKVTDAEISRFLMHDFDKKTTREVDWLLGSCLFIRTKALQEVGVFDERFFVYFEDTDLCRRFWNKGWRVIYYPEAAIIHNHNRESAQQAWYKFFLHPASRRHVTSWRKYIMKWGLRIPPSH